MNKIIDENNKNISNEEINLLENKLNYKFDDDYKDFLMKYNGGIPEKDTLEITNLDSFVDEVEFSEFCSVLKEKYKPYTILEETEKYVNDQRILKKYIVIGRTSSGSLILINKKDNLIYYWDRDFEVSNGEIPTENNCYLIAKNFKDFFEKKLYEFE